MKRFAAIVFFIVLADGSVARKCDFNSKVNLTLLADDYANAALTFPTPTMENGEHFSHTLKKNFVELRRNYFVSMQTFVYQMGLAVGDQLIDAVQKAYAELEESIKLISKDSKKSDRVEKSLKSLTEQFRIFLDLKPEVATIEPPILPALPPQPTEISSRSTNRTASEYFLHLAEFISGGSFSVHGFISAINLRGLKSSRNSYGILQTQYRNEILRGSVLDAYKKAAKQVFKNGHTVQRQVKPVTWYSFKEAGDRIIAISVDDCKDSSEKEWNHENHS